MEPAAVFFKQIKRNFRDVKFSPSLMLCSRKGVEIPSWDSHSINEDGLKSRHGSFTDFFFVKYPAYGPFSPNHSVGLGLRVFPLF
jgi:hypothetical protein